MVMQVSRKIVVLGHFGVGKTSLIRRFVLDSFSDNYKVSIGVHISKKPVEISPDDTLSLIIWDLEGTDDIQTIRDSYLLGTHGILYIFDVTRPSTFQNLNQDVPFLEEKMPNIPILVIGNKVDLVVPNELEPLLKNNDITYSYLASAKTGGMVNEVFRELATAIHSNA